jgi:hypothetical protein
MFTTASKKMLRNMRDLVQPFLRFRCKVYYPEFSKHRSGTFYGEEWSCTIDQVVWKKVPLIELDRMKGYMDLVNMIENGYLKNKYTTAMIFEFDGKDYNIICRKYIGGRLDTSSVADPVFEKSNSRITLVPRFKKLPGTKDMMISVEPYKPPVEVPDLNFKTEIEDALKHKPQTVNNEA